MILRLANRVWRVSQIAHCAKEQELNRFLTLSSCTFIGNRDRNGRGRKAIIQRYRRCSQLRRQFRLEPDYRQADSDVILLVLKTNHIGSNTRVLIIPAEYCAIPVVLMTTLTRSCCTSITRCQAHSRAQGLPLTLRQTRVSARLGNGPGSRRRRLDWLIRKHRA